MFENKKVLILGFARSGYETAKILINRGNVVILNDSKEEEKHDASKVEELRNMGVKFVFGGHPDDLLDDSFNYDNISNLEIRYDVFENIKHIY